MSKILWTLALLTVMLAAAIAVAAPHHGPIDVVIDDAKDKRAGVAFQHGKHSERVESCDTCHHTQEGLTAKTDAKVQACSACHLDPEKASTPSMREMSLSKNPFHSLCIDCHKAEAKGPTKCDDCHPKG